VNVEFSASLTQLRWKYINVAIVECLLLDIADIAEDSTPFSKTFQSNNYLNS
jgi:hypothetical protein